MGKFFADYGFVNAGDLVFDIGVRDGKYTRQFLASDARVICVEPYPEHVKRMQEKFGKRIIVVEAAVSDVAGTATLHTSKKLKANPTLVPDIFVKQFGKSRTVYDGKIEVKLRREKEARFIPKDEITGYIRDLIQKELTWDITK